MGKIVKKAVSMIATLLMAIWTAFVAVVLVERGKGMRVKKIQKAFAFVLIVVTVTLSLPLAMTMAETAGVLTYTLNGTDATITKCSKNATSEQVDEAFAQILSAGYTVTSLGAWTDAGQRYFAFWDCQALTTINIPDTVTSMSTGPSYYFPFSGLKNLTAINCGENGGWFSHEGVLYSKDRTFLYKCPEGKEGKYVVPDGTLAMYCSPIGSGGAFNDCSKLTEVVLPDSLIDMNLYSGVNVDGYTFSNCTNLKTVTLPDGSNMEYSEKKIGEYDFAFCENLMSLLIPNGYHAIEEMAFYYCTSLQTVTIPASVTQIGETAFNECDKLTILGVRGSYAEQYADEHDIPFVAVGDDISFDESEYSGSVGDTVTLHVTYNGNSQPNWNVSTWSCNDVGGVVFLDGTSWNNPITEIGAYHYSKEIKLEKDGVWKVQIKLADGSIASTTVTVGGKTEIEFDNDNYISEIGETITVSGIYHSQINHANLETLDVYSNDQTVTIGALSVLPSDDGDLFSVTVTGTRIGRFEIRFDTTSDQFENVSASVILKVVKLLPDFNSAFNFKNDVWFFGNYIVNDKYSNESRSVPLSDSYDSERVSSITERYFTKLFGDVSGNMLFNQHPNSGNGGHCYGMAITQGAIFEGYPSINTFNKIVPSYKDNGSFLDLGDISGYESLISTSSDLGITASAFIDYGHIFQFSSNQAKHLYRGYDLTDELRQLIIDVKSFEATGRNPVLIGLHPKSGGNGTHEIMAIGAIENADGSTSIVVSDSNQPYDENKTLLIRAVPYPQYEKAWSYTDGLNSYDSLGWDIDHETPTRSFYSAINDALSGQSIGDTLFQIDSPNATVSIGDISSNIQNFMTDSDWLSPVPYEAGGSVTDQESHLYWISGKNDKVCIDGLSMNSILKMSYINKSVTLLLFSDSKAEFSVTDDKLLIKASNMPSQENAFVKYSWSNGDHLNEVIYDITVFNSDLALDASDVNHPTIIGVTDYTISAFVDDVKVDEKTVTGVDPVTGSTINVTDIGDDLQIIIDNETNKTTLSFAIASAISAKTGISVSVDGSDILTTSKWVTQATLNALNDAIAAAQVVLNNASATQAEIVAAVTALNDARSAFLAAAKYGSKISGGGSSSGGGGGYSGGSWPSSYGVNINNEPTPQGAIQKYEVMKPLHPAGTQVKAEVSTNTLVLNSIKTMFPAFKIDGYNWLKLRDVAGLLNNSKKQFKVDWNAATNTITITSGKSYVSVGDELQDISKGEYVAYASTQRIILDGKEIVVAAYNVNGYNYFRLRDLAILLDFGVDWDEKEELVTLDLNSKYKE